jgi:hypothetical protein
MIVKLMIKQSTVNSYYTKYNAKILLFHSHGCSRRLRSTLVTGADKCVETYHYASIALKGLIKVCDIVKHVGICFPNMRDEKRGR